MGTQGLADSQPLAIHYTPVVLNPTPPHPTPGDIGQCLETFRTVTAGEVQQSPSGQKPGMLLNVPHIVEQSLQRRVTASQTSGVLRVRDPDTDHPREPKNSVSGDGKMGVVILVMGLE